MQPDENTTYDNNAAADLIRHKLDALYGSEPDAAEEKKEVEALPENVLSKHQKFMKELSSSGRSLAEIQTAWHEYYTGLDDTGKHQVWQEFYSEHEKTKNQPAVVKEPEPIPKPVQVPVSHNTATLQRRKKDTRASSDIKQQLISQIQDRAQFHKNPHVRSIAFGLSMGSVTIFVLLFGFFNERFITPFIRPSSTVSATPIIVDPTANEPVGPEAKIIIPKINVEAPVVYDVPTIDEKDIQTGLERGVVHYITTAQPGEKGNSVIFGHSSSNILNKGKYKFAFILLKSLDKDDTFIVHKDGKRYVYKVFSKFVTAPTDLSILGPPPEGKSSIMTLVTCDPPGTSTNRLIIQAEQIFPDPAANAESSAKQATVAQPAELPSNSITLWQRFKNLF